MGEVYRARDSRLSREVAIKVLPEAVLRDAERLARFRREAQVLASLNHPHIASIYGVEEQAGQEALILELVEGETLAERIARGPLPQDEALEIARQIARALEAAHEKGIVHRDLKPANVKLDRAGQVKVLDFGLAKAFSADGSSPDITSSPTLTAAATQAGVVIGTAAYMSPEQARGKSVDRRADIWAFAAVLYEMLAGRKAFEGETVSDTLAAILTKEPDWSALPSQTPASVKRVLRRCLDRDPKTRMHDIADARLELDEPMAPEPASVSTAPAKTRFPLWAAAAGLVLVLAAGAGWWRAMKARPSAPPQVTGYAVAVPGKDQIPFDDSPVLELSRDGASLVFISEGDGRRQLYVRTRDRIEPKPVPGTAGAYSPFFAPDGQWLGFFADGKLKKVPVSGGTPIVLADAPSNRGGVWLEDDTIVFAPTYTSGLSRVSSRGGKVEELTVPDPKAGERTHRWPTYVPGDTSVLFTIGLLSGPGNYDDARIAVWEPATGRTRVVYEGGTMPRIAGSSHLVFWRGGTMLAAGFDAKGLRVRGEPLPLADRTAGDASSGIAYAAVAADGTFAFVPQGTPGERRLVLTDRSGKPTPVPGPPREYHYPRFSPDGKRLAVSIGPGHGHSDDVWICDIATGALTRLTFGDGNGNYYPVWSPDGKRVAYSSDRAHQGVFMKNADGSGEERPLRLDPTSEIAQDWSRDGSRLLLDHNYPVTDILSFDFQDGRTSPVATTAGAPVFSPDGRWIAYTALATGSSSSQPQIVVRPSSGPGGRMQLTSDMGYFPVWTDRELIFLVDRSVVAVEAQTEPTFRAGPQRVLFEMLYDRGTEPLREYDVTRDGQTFVFVGGSGDRIRKQVDVVLGWAAVRLARQLPAGK